MVKAIAIIAVVIFWNFGTLAPCDVLREAARQRDNLAAVLPDGMVDLIATEPTKWLDYFEEHLPILGLLSNDFLYLNNVCLCVKNSERNDGDEELGSV